jgi:hypothetical protein
VGDGLLVLTEAVVRNAEVAEAIALALTIAYLTRDRQCLLMVLDGLAEIAQAAVRIAEAAEVTVKQVMSQGEIQEQLQRVLVEQLILDDGWAPEYNAQPLAELGVTSLMAPLLMEELGLPAVAMQQRRLYTASCSTAYSTPPSAAPQHTHKKLSPVSVPLHRKQGPPRKR